MRLVILQPFYLPYGGVFELVRLADTFLVYDDVQFVHQGWQVRNRVKTAQGPTWLTVPVQRRHGQRICDALISDRIPWARKHWRTIEQSYGRTDGYELLERHLKPRLMDTPERLVDLNLATFEVLCELVGVRSTMLRSSALPLPGRASERVLRYCLELGAERYLSGPSARDYLDEHSFEANGIELEYFEFDHPTYPQPYPPFVPALSVVDLIAGVGRGAGEVLAGCGRPVPVGEYTTSREERRA